MAFAGAGRECCRSERRSASPGSADGVMVRPMKPFRRKATFAIVSVVAVAVVGLLGFHALASSRRPTVLACPKQPGLALGCYEERYRFIVAQKGVAAAFADLKAMYPNDSAAQRLCHA